jgi:acetylornithine deacetylase/succinyl-diaminopimelate desuccinylase-like protein
LEAGNKRIGSVAGVQAYRWLTITVHGRESHTGTTDFENRSDAMITASRMIVHSRTLAERFAALASTGILSLEPGSTNTIPGKVTFTLDLRCTEDERLEAFERQLRADFEAIARDDNVDGLTPLATKSKGCSFNIKVDTISTATNFDATCQECVSESAKAMAANEGLDVDEIFLEGMTSGAGHDR